MSVEFIGFPKIGRLKRNCVITEKIDGTNAGIQIVPTPVEPGTPYCAIVDDFALIAQSRKHIITPDKDNHGFAAWVANNAPELVKLGPGVHFGEWWGQGIQRKYGLKEKRLSLFNVHRWTPETLPACCSTVPILYEGLFCDAAISDVMFKLAQDGSTVAPGFMNPEGIIVYHSATRTLFKRTFESDAEGKECAA